jgi:hypothetical protein
MAIHAHFEQTFGEIDAAGQKVSQTLTRLTNSAKEDENAVGLLALNEIVSETVLRALKNDSAALDASDIRKLMDGKWKQTGDYLRMEKALKEMRKVSRDWYRWATWAARGDLMKSY